MSLAGGLRELLRPPPHRGPLIAAGGVALAVGVALTVMRLGDAAPRAVTVAILLVSGGLLYWLGAQAPNEDGRPPAYQSVLIATSLPLIFAGLIVLGVPCNDFGAQEPGSDEEIKGFCETNYQVSFPMAGKVEILNRDRRHPFYKWIAAQIGEEALPRWNFHKFLIGKDGALEGAFSSQTPPLGVDIVGAVEKSLSA